MLILGEIHSWSLGVWQRLMIFLLDKTAEQSPPFSDGLY